MTHAQILEYCKRAGKVGAVNHEEFIDFVLVMVNRKKVDNEWVTVESPYMAVDGRIAMANEDHRRQTKKMDIGPATVIANTDTELTLQVAIESEIYGKRHGIATSRKIAPEGKKPSAEQELPWEVAETSAIGRALGEFGYGIFPGSGLASADDMQRVQTDAENKNKARAQAGDETRQTSTSKRTPLSPTQRKKIIDLFAQARGTTANEAESVANAEFTKTFKHPMNDGTYDEGTRFIATLMQEGKR